MRGHLTNCTFIQVEALKECFDFLNNGYIDEKGWFGDDKWLIYLRHCFNGNKIKMTIRRFSYIIEKNSKLVKSVEGLEDLDRYDCTLDSQVVIKAKRREICGCSRLISGSDLPDVEPK